MYTEVPAATVPNDDFQFRSPEPPPRPKTAWWRGWCGAGLLVLTGSLIGGLTSLIVMHNYLTIHRDFLGPVKWGAQFNVERGVVVSGGTRRLRMSGQLPLAADGTVMYKGDMRGQMIAALNNVDMVLTSAKMSTQDVVKVHLYTTNITEVVQNYGVYFSYMANGGVAPPITYVGVDQLFNKDCLVQFDVDAEQ